MGRAFRIQPFAPLLSRRSAMKRTSSRKRAGGERLNLPGAMRRSAENRTCPKCGRKGAVTKTPGDPLLVGHCRWPDCGWAEARPVPPF
jgi:hypothetical protein